MRITLVASALVVCGGALTAMPSSAGAQQAIITMPSADTTPARQFFAMHESQLRLWGPSPVWAGTYFLTYGIGSNTELAVTLFDIGVDRRGALYGNATLAAGFKSWVPIAHRQAPALELGIITGGMGLASIRDGSFGGWMYAIPCMRLPVLHTRIAAGVSFATEQLYGAGQQQFSFAASIEQPVPGVHDLNLVAEWFSGQHDLSNLIVGATWHVLPALMLVMGWKIPTKDGIFHVDEQALVFEVGTFLPRWGAGHRHPEVGPISEEPEPPREASGASPPSGHAAAHP
jgi:hypothetical protein